MIQTDPGSMMCWTWLQSDNKMIADLLVSWDIDIVTPVSLLLHDDIFVGIAFDYTVFSFCNSVKE